MNEKEILETELSLLKKANELALNFEDKKTDYTANDGLYWLDEQLSLFSVAVGKDSPRYKKIASMKASLDLKAKANQDKAEFY